MVSIYTPDKCLYRLDWEFREFFNMPMRQEHLLYDCENCNGRNKNGKECHISLMKLLDHEDFEMPKLTQFQREMGY